MFKTAEDGHVYNDDKKHSGSHHGSVRPGTGIKSKGMKRNGETNPKGKVYIADKTTFDNHEVKLRGDVPPHSSLDKIFYGNYGGWELIVDGFIVKRSNDIDTIYQDYDYPRKFIKKLEEKELLENGFDPNHHSDPRKFNPESY